MMGLLDLGELARCAGGSTSYTGIPAITYLDTEVTETHISITHRMETKWISNSTSAPQAVSSVHSSSIPV